MVSFDIESLYTNIPLKETIEICINKIFNNTNTFLNFDKKQFKSLLETITNNTFFTFNNKLYQQIDGIAMGSPIAPTLANIFLCQFENEWLKNCPVDFTPAFYRMDDTFVLFKNHNQAKLFLDYLNSKHPNIKFTIETETNKTLPFLDTLITRTNNVFSSSTYRKPTFTGLGLNFLSCTPMLYKINTIKALIYRAYNLNSTFTLFHKEITFLLNYFKSNNFPLYIVYSQIKLS